MKASELIAQLNEQIAKNGDLPVVFAVYGKYDGTLENFDQVDGYPSHEHTPDGHNVIVLWDE
jgi:hypothetical protein